MKIKKKMRNLYGNRLDATRAEAAITLIAIASGELTESGFCRLAARLRRAAQTDDKDK